MFVLPIMAFALFSCSPEDDPSNNNPNNNQTDSTSVATSYVIYDGVTYPMYDLDANHVNSSSSISMTSAISAFWNRDAWPRNKTINLASPAAGERYWIGVDGSVLNLNAYGQGREEDGSFTGFYEMNGENFDQVSAFNSGSYGVYTEDPSGEGDPIRIELDGVLKNGKRLQVKLVSSNSRQIN